MTRLAACLIRAAVGRLRRSHPEWADALEAEAPYCGEGVSGVAWAWGCWVASLRMSPSGLAYALALAAGLTAMAAYEWSADESLATLGLVSLIAAALGLYDPPRAALSGALVGVVVACVTAFEAVTGIRPGYETQGQTLSGCLFWMLLLLPALGASVAGARLARQLHPPDQLP